MHGTPALLPWGQALQMETLMPEDITTEALLRAAFTVSGGGPEGAGAATLDDERAAQLRLYARTQYSFYVAFQALVLVLAVAIAWALVVVVTRLLDQTDVQTVLAGLSAVATSAGAVFLQNQANKAKSRYDDALALLGDARA